MNDFKGITTAQVGCIPIKRGKNDVAFDFGMNMAYDNKTLLKARIEQIESDYTKALSDLKQTYDKSIEALQKELKTLKTSYEETLKGLMTR